MLNIILEVQDVDKKNNPKDKKRNPSSETREQKEKTNQTIKSYIWWVDGQKVESQIIYDNQVKVCVCTG